jgi:Sortilin, neurotensin receptor 3,/PKD domain
MKKSIKILFFFLLFGSTVSAQLANWSPGSNPTFTNFPVNSSGQINGFGRIVQMKFHATDPTKLYAVTAEGGFFTSTNTGTNWTVKQGTENLTGSCASLCVDYTNDQVIYMGSGDPSYYSNGSGVYKSTNGGTTFTATTLTNCLVVEILQDPNNSGTFVAATNKGIYKSTNNGSTWTPTTATSIPFCDLKRNAAPNSSILYACSKENTCRYFRSTDFGGNWTPITTGITTATAFITAGGRVGVTPADPNVVYFEAIGGGGIIHKSVDGGLTFVVQKIQGTGTLANPYLTFYDFDNANGLASQGNYNNSIVVDATNPAKIWLQAHNTWLSTDSGVTWTEITHWSTKVHTDMHQIQQSPFDSTKLYSCNDGGIWLSTDGGNNWVTKSDGLYAYEIYANCGKSSNTDKNSISIGTQDNGRLFRNDTGWFTDRGGDDTRQKEYDYLPNGGNYYEKTQTSRKASNGGATSATGFPTTTGNYWEYLAFNRSNTSLGFMWFTDNKLYRTTNLSAATPTWTNVFTFTVPVMAMHSCIADPNKLYVITNDGKIQVSSNVLSATPTFATYTLPSVTNSIASITAIANNANAVYISINDKVYVSINSGATWTNITYNLPAVNHRKIQSEEFGGTQELVFIATNNAVYYKKVGQVSWTNYSTNLPGRRSPTNFTMYDDGTNQAVLRYYTYGRGVWETPFSNLRILTADFVASSTTPCTGATVNFTDLSIGNVTTRTWSFLGGTPSTSTAASPSVVYTTPGVYDVTLQVSDGITTNTITKTAYINLNGTNLPLTESFEGATNPPTGWVNLDNSSPGKAWAKTATAGGFGLTTSSMLYDNYSYNVVGEKDELQVKKLNFSGLSTASLSFDVAYQVYNGYSDALTVLISTDCGVTFTSIYSKSGATLSTAGSGTNDFVPIANQWRKETINLNSYIGYSNVLIRFQNTNGFGNKLYLDNIAVTGVYSSNLNLKLNIEGYYDTSVHAMRPVRANQGIGTSTTDVENIIVELHDPSTFALIASTMGTLQKNGVLAVSFSSAPVGSFYIAVRGINCVKTWSTTAQTIGSTVLNYDFTTSVSKAYGNNMVQVEPGVWAIYSGDINQDEAIDNSDTNDLFIDIENSSYGVLATDLNGDGAIDNSDTDDIFINIENSIYSNHP